MSAAFEVTIMCSEIISFNVIKNALNNYKFEINEIEVIDDWQYNNQKKMQKALFFEIDELINNNKIVLIGGTLNCIHNCGITAFMHESGAYCVTFWFSTKEMKSLDCDFISSENVEIYDNLTKIIIETVDYNKLIFCGIGPELFMPNCIYISDVILNSKNVCRWIISNSKKINLPNSYKKDIHNQFLVYSIFEGSIPKCIKQKQ